MRVIDRISKKVGVCGGDACIRGTRIPVWVIEARRRRGESPEDLLENYPSLSLDDLNAARLYASEHRAEINREIRQNWG